MGLADVPFYGAFRERENQIQQEPMRELQQAGAAVALKKSIQQQAQEQAMRQELEAAPNEEARIAVAAKYASPDRLLDIQQRTLDRRSAQEERARQFAETVALRQQTLEQQRDAFQQRTQDAQSRAQFDQWYRGQQLVLQQQQASVNAELKRLGIQVQQQANDIRTDAAKNKPLTEFQGKNAMFGSRAAMADRTLTGLEEKISLIGLSMKEGIQKAPVVGGALGAVANTALSADQQKVEQAQRNFVNAVLRQESGAVIGKDEFDNAKKQYFPQPGDSKEVIAQKRTNRSAAISGFKRIAGPAAWADVEEQLKQSVIPSGGAVPPLPPGFTLDQ
jgi:hypothetical protein